MADSINLSDQSKIYDFDAEQAVLGCVLLDAHCFTVASLRLRTEYFYFPQHQAIFSIMQQLDLSTGTIDPLMLADRLRKEKAFSGEDGGKQYLMQLTDAVPSASNIETYCGIVEDKYFIRTLVTVSNEIIDMAENSGMSAQEMIDQAEHKIYAIQQGKTDDQPQSLGKMINRVYDTLVKLNSDEREQYKGLPTGFPDFDNMCTGLNKSDLVIVGARPAMGKTSFALNMARNVAVKTKKNVLFFSLEMSNEQLAQRVIATEARISSKKMRTGELTPSEWDSLLSACMFLADVPLFFDDTSSVTVPQMKSKIRRFKNLGAVFVDYLQLMKSADKKIDSRVQEVSDITRNLKLMAKDLNIPVVVCAQLSRGTESRGNKSHRPQLADLRESGSIEQDADVVLMLYRKSYYQNDNDNAENGSEDDNKQKINVNLADLLVAKNRHGETGDIRLAWNPEYTLFTCIDHNNDAAQ